MDEPIRLDVTREAIQTFTDAWDAYVAQCGEHEPTTTQLLFLTSYAAQAADLWEQITRHCNRALKAAVLER